MNGRLVEFWDDAAQTAVKVLAFVLPLAFYLKTYDAGIAKEITLLVGTCLIWFFSAASHFEAGRVQWPANRTGLAILAKLLLGWTLLSLLSSAHPELSGTEVLRFTFFITLFLIVLTGPASVSFAAGLSTATAASAAVAGLYAVSQSAGFDPLLWKGAFGRQSFATLAEPELFGVFTAAAFPLALSLTVDPMGRPAGRWAARAAAVTCLAGAVLSGSNVALAALGTGTALFAIFALTRLGDAGKAAGLAAAATLLVAEIASGLHGGSGFGGLGQLSAAATLVPVVSGPTGMLLAAGILLGTLTLSLFDLLRRSRAGEVGASALIGGQWAAACGLLIAHVFGPAGLHAAPGVYLWLLCGSLAGLALEKGGAIVHVVPIPAGPLLRRVLYAPAAALVALGFFVSFGSLGSDRAYNIGIYLAGQGRTAEAAARLESVSLWHPAGLDARYLAANLLAGQGDHEDALRRYDLIETYARHYRRLDYRKALVLNDMYRKYEAETSLLAYLDRHQDDPDAYRLMAMVATDINKPAEAHAAALELLRIAPEDPRNWFLLAELYKQRGRYDMARKMLDRASKVQDYANSKKFLTSESL